MKTPSAMPFKTTAAQPLRPFLRPFPSPQGFTLAESLFALAILSFTMLTLIGFLPNTLGSLNASERRSAEARIVRSLVSEFEVTPWAQQQNLASQKSNLAFDANGTPISPGAPEVAYVARVEITPLGPILGAQPSPSLRRLRILIGNTPQTDSLNRAQNRVNHDHSALLLRRDADDTNSSASPQ